MECPVWRTFWISNTVTVFNTFSNSSKWWSQKVCFNRKDATSQNYWRILKYWEDFTDLRGCIWRQPVAAGERMWLSTRRRSGRGKCRVHWELKAGAPLRHIYSLTGESAGVLTAERLEQNILQGLGGGQVCGRIHSDVVLWAVRNSLIPHWTSAIQQTMWICWIWRRKKKTPLYETFILKQTV